MVVAAVVIVHRLMALMALMAEIMVVVVEAEAKEGRWEVAAAQAAPSLSVIFLPESRL